MNSSILSQISPFHSTDLPSPWKSNKLPTFFPKTLTISKNKWQQQANAKGFTSKKPQPVKETKLDFESPKAQNSDDDYEEIPKDVFNRIALRACVFVGVPIVLGYGFLSVFGAISERGYEVPRWLPFFTSLLTFGSSCFGIAYGALSASWDPDRQGSLLGFEEVQKHWVEMWEEEDKSS